MSDEEELDLPPDPGDVDPEDEEESPDEDGAETDAADPEETADPEPDQGAADKKWSDLFRDPDEAERERLIRSDYPSMAGMGRNE